MLLRELKVVYQATREEGFNPQVNTPEEAAASLSNRLQSEAVEVCVLLCVNVKHRLLCWHELSRGDVSRTLIHPREVFKVAVLANASGIVLGHNHPSGDPVPSPDDLVLTRRIRHAGELMGIELLDHVIVGDSGRYYSFRELGGL